MLNRKKILIVKIGAIGDIVMALPLISEIKNRYPRSHITWVCGNVVFDLLKSIPDIDIVLNINEKKVFSKNKFEAVKELISFQRKYAFKKFDVVLNLHHDNRYKLFSSLVRTQCRLHFSRNGERPTLIPGRSRAFEHVRLFLQSDSSYSGNIAFPIDSISVECLSTVNETFDLLQKRFVIIAPGGAKNSLNEQELRRWPIEYYVKVAAYLLSKNIAVVVTGISSDDWVLTYFSELKIVNLIGKLSIVQLIAIMRKSEVVLTHDSGPFHLSVFAQKCYVLGLFGPTNPNEFTYGKLTTNVKTLWAGGDMLCSPCYFGKHFSAQCLSNVCLQVLKPDLVIDVLDEFLIN